MTSYLEYSIVEFSLALHVTPNCDGSIAFV